MGCSYTDYSKKVLVEESVMKDGEPVKKDGQEKKKFTVQDTGLRQKLITQA